MPRLNHPFGLDSRPSTIALVELAIAAGVVGKPVTVSLADYPAHIPCEMWKYFTQAIGRGGVLEVRTARDVKSLATCAGHLRVVLLHSPRLLSHVLWTIQLAAERFPTSPALICNFGIADAESVPGPVLLLRCDDPEKVAIEHWLLDGNERSNAQIALPPSVHFPPRLESMLNSIARNGSGFCAVKLVLSLLAGASLLRTAVDGGNDATSISVTHNDYSLVRAMLCGSIVKRDQFSCDALTMQMIQRANVYLTVKYGDRSSQNPFYSPSTSPMRGGRNAVPKRLITRGELADLGNVRSSFLVKLVEYLQSGEDGFALYQRMAPHASQGAVHDWRRTPSRQLTRQLSKWSIKQVRSRFERLVSDGLITAEREVANGPLQYRIPEELGNLSSPFATLPEDSMLEEEDAA